MSSWKGQTRGGLAGYSIFIFVLKRFGLRTAYALLIFVVPYFTVTAPVARHSIYSFHRKILGKSVGASTANVFRSFYVFGQTIIDKIAIQSGLRQKFTYSFSGRENLESLQKSGGIILSAHLGSWDVAGALMDEFSQSIHILMFQAEHQKIKNYLDTVMQESNVKIIPIRTDFSHLFTVNAVLKKKELVCMHGDRFVEGSRYIVRKFLGKPAAFPLGPFQMISKLGVPSCIAFGVRKGGKEYALSSTEIIEPGTNPETLLDYYLQVLEEKLLENPLQWFNYYDFWQDV